MLLIYLQLFSAEEIRVSQLRTNPTINSILYIITRRKIEASRQRTSLFRLFKRARIKKLLYARVMNYIFRFRPTAQYEV